MKKKYGDIQRRTYPESVASLEHLEVVGTRV